MEEYDLMGKVESNMKLVVSYCIYAHRAILWKLFLCSSTDLKSKGSFRWDFFFHFLHVFDWLVSLLNLMLQRKLGNNINWLDLCYLSIHLPKINHSFAKCCIRYCLPIILNRSATYIFHKLFTHSLKGFSIYVKKDFIKNYIFVCTNVNCYVCNDWLMNLSFFFFWNYLYIYSCISLSLN